MSPAMMRLLALPGVAAKVTLPLGHVPVTPVPVAGLEKPLSPTRILLLILNALPISAWSFVGATVTAAADTARTKTASAILAPRYRVNVRRSQRWKRDAQFIPEPPRVSRDAGLRLESLRPAYPGNRSGQRNRTR